MSAQSTVPPRVAIIIPSFDGLDLLRPCLAALHTQTFRDFTVTVVDDGSTDGTAAWLATAYPAIRTIRHKHNRGLAAACNAGIVATTSDLVCLLNNDTEAEPTWLGALVAALDAAQDAGSASSKMLLFDRRDTLHSAGDGFTVAGMPVNRGVWQIDRGQYDDAAPPFGPCAGAALYRRAALLAVADERGAVLDPDLYMYCEDVDLAWRLQRAGYSCVFAPAARIHHHLSATGGGTFASYLVGRNLLLLLAKDLPRPLLRRYWPRIVATQAGRAWRAARAWRGAEARATLRGMLAALPLLPRFWRKGSALGRLSPAESARIERLLLHPRSR